MHIEMSIPSDFDRLLRLKEKSKHRLAFDTVDTNLGRARVKDTIELDGGPIFLVLEITDGEHKGREALGTLNVCKPVISSS